MRTNHDKLAKLLLSACAAGSLGLISTPASAAPRSWVSSSGSDASACTRTSPCRTFGSAFAKTDAGGEIDCIDPADYGFLNITKAITISCNGIGNAAIAATNGGIYINAKPADAIVIDGLVISGSANAVYGIYVQAAGSVVVRNTTIRNVSQFGIYFGPSATATLNVDSSAIIGVGTAAINIAPSGSASVRVTVFRSQFSNNGYGLYMQGGGTTGSLFASLRGVNISNSGYDGIHTIAGSATNATVALDEVTVAGNVGYGLFAEGPKAGFLVNNTTITNNQGGGVNPDTGGVIYSYGNNRVNGNNANDGSFTATLQQR